MTDDTYTTRRARTRDRLAAVDADGLVCFPSRNLQYLTGFNEEPGERHFLLIVPATDPATLLVPELYGEQVRSETDVDDVRTWADGDDPREAARDVLDEHDLRSGRLLVDDTMWARFTQDLRAVA
ncbi:aminopeptidase P family N-terminal domain-containing protein, partial [Halorubrum tibetense]